MTLPPDLKDRVAALEKMFPDIHPSVRNLFVLLPPAGVPFPAEDRANFIRAAACIFAMVYGPTDPLKIEVVSQANGELVSESENEVNDCVARGIRPTGVDT